MAIIFVAGITAAVILTGNPGQKLEGYLSNLRSTAPQTAVQPLKSPALTGTIHTELIDNPNGKADAQLVLNTDDGKFIDLPYKINEIDPAILQNRVKINNLQDPKSINIINKIMQPFPNTKISNGNYHNILVITLYDDGVPAPNHAYDAQIKQEMDLAAKVYTRNSDGNLSIKFTYFPEELHYTQSFFGNDLNFLDENIDLSKYTDYFVIVFSPEKDWCEGRSFVGPHTFTTQKGNLTFGLGHVDFNCLNLQPGTPVHELGHLLGLGHADSFTNGPQMSYLGFDYTPVTGASPPQCQGLNITDPQVIKDMEIYQSSNQMAIKSPLYCFGEYEDDTLMGESAYPSWNSFLLSPTQRKILGSNINTLAVTTSGTYKLSANTLKDGGYNELEIPAGDQGSYSVEYRNLPAGIVIRFVPGKNLNENLIKFKAVSSGDTYRIKDFYDSALSKGESFTDSYKKITITYLQPVTATNTAINTKTYTLNGTTPGTKPQTLNNAANNLLLLENSADVKITFGP